MSKHTELSCFLFALFIDIVKEEQDGQLSRFWVTNYTESDIEEIFEEFQTIQLLYDREEKCMYFFIDWSIAL